MDLSIRGHEGIFFYLNFNRVMVAGIVAMSAFEGKIQRVVHSVHAFGQQMLESSDSRMD